MSPASIAYLYAILYSPRETIEIPGVGHNAPVVYFRVVQGLDLQQMRSKVDQALKRLAESMTFKFAHHSTRPNVKDYTSPLYPDPAEVVAISIVDEPGREGVVLTITLDPDFLACLETLHSQGENSIGQLLSLQSSMAKVYAHEMVHAVHMAINSSLLACFSRRKTCKTREEFKFIKALPPREPCFEDQRSPELGLCFENYVFNGTSIRTIANVDGPMILHEWPVQTQIPPTLVPLDFISRLQRQEFWDNMDPKDVKALYLAKLVSFPHESDSDLDSVREGQEGL